MVKGSDGRGQSADEGEEQGEKGSEGEVSLLMRVDVLCRWSKEGISLGGCLERGLRGMGSAC